MVKLRALWWLGPAPAEGDTMRTSTGRRYLLVRVRPVRPPAQGYALEAVILPEFATLPPTSREFTWTWRKRRRLPAQARRQLAREHRAAHS